MQVLPQNAGESSHEDEENHDSYGGIVPAHGEMDGCGNSSDDQEGNITTPSITPKDLVDYEREDIHAGLALIIGAGLEVEI